METGHISPPSYITQKIPSFSDASAVDKLVTVFGRGWGKGLYQLTYAFTNLLGT